MTTPTTKSPNLEVISSSRPAPAERRRLPRLGLSGAQLRLSQTGKIFSVDDLSLSGLGIRILDRADFMLFPVAAVFEGMLNLKGEKHPVVARVRHLAPEAVGCEFETLADSVRGALERFLDPQVLGRDLKLIPASEMSTLWYHGSSGADLLVHPILDGAGYSRMSLYMLGSFVQWSVEAGLETGQARQTDVQVETRGALRFETRLIEPDESPDSGKLGVAKTLILSSNLDEAFKKWCLEKLEG